MNANDARQETDIQADQEASPELASGQPALFRPLHDRMLAGVAAGIANYLGVDVTVVRIVLAVLVFVGGAVSARPPALRSPTRLQPTRLKEVLSDARASKPPVDHRIHRIRPPSFVS